MTAKATKKTEERAWPLDSAETPQSRTKSLLLSLLNKTLSTFGKEKKKAGMSKSFKAISHRCEQWINVYALMYIAIYLMRQAPHVDLTHGVCICCSKHIIRYFLFSDETTVHFKSNVTICSLQWMPIIRLGFTMCFCLWGAKSPQGCRKAGVFSRLRLLTCVRGK